MPGSSSCFATRQPWWPPCWHPGTRTGTSRCPAPLANRVTRGTRARPRRQRRALPGITVRMRSRPTRTGNQAGVRIPRRALRPAMRTTASSRTPFRSRLSENIPGRSEHRAAIGRSVARAGRVVRHLGPQPVTATQASGTQDCGTQQVQGPSQFGKQYGPEPGRRTVPAGTAAAGWMATQRSQPRGLG